MMIKPKKHMGQNFLTDEGILSQIADHIHLKEGCCKIVEIGAGLGNLTSALLSKGCKNIIAVEKDSRFIPHLQKIAGDFPGKLEIIPLDAKNILWRELEGPLYIVGNLPYYIATHLILQWMEMTPLWNHCTVMVQEEVADKILEAKGSSISILTSLFLNSEEVLSVPPRAFYPMPTVRSKVIHLSPRKDKPEVDLLILKKVLRALFQKRRKMISYTFPAEELERIHIKATARPEDLTLEEFITLTRQDLRKL